MKQNLNLICLIPLLVTLHFSIGTIALALPFKLEEKWEPFDKGIEAKEAIVHPEALFPSRIIFVKLDPKEFDLRVINSKDYGYKALTAKEISLHSGAILAINSNFFDEKGDPLGLVISDFEDRNRIHKGGRTLSGVFLKDAEGYKIVHRDTFPRLNIEQATQAGPRLVINGEPVAGIKDKFSSRRAGVCLTRENTIIFFCVSSAFFSLDIESLQRLLISPEIGCLDALNLDGGGSAQIYGKAKISKSTNQVTIENKSDNTEHRSENEQSSEVRAVSFNEILVEGIDRVPVFLGVFHRKNTGSQSAASQLEVKTTIEKKAEITP